jgi:arabinose-5-phosphate isomerase
MVTLIKKKNYKKIAYSVINLEINALRKLKNSINNSFNEAVDAIYKCQSKIILCGVGKSGLIASKIAATLSSVGSPAFSLSASDCSHGDLGSISKKDVLILISYSGETQELKNIIQYSNRNRITLIGIVSKKKSLLYRASDIALYIPEVSESGHGIVPTSSTTAQLCLGDALAIATMEKKKFSKIDFKKFHPSGSLGAKLKTAEDLMLKGSQIPFVNENLNMKSALKVITEKKLGVLVIRNTKGFTSGITVDGDIKRAIQKNKDIQNLTIKSIMTKNPISIEKKTLAVKALSIMNKKKITSLCIHEKKNKKKTIGILHIHNILEANVV